MNKYLKRIIPILITLLLVWFIVRQGIRWRDFKTVIMQARWGWLLLALIFQAGSYSAITWLNEILLRHYGAHVAWGRQFFIQLAMAFVEAVVPSAAISGVLLRARLLKPYNVSSDIAVITTVAETSLVVASILLMILPIIILALFQIIQIFWSVTIILISSLIAIEIIRQPRKSQLSKSGIKLVRRLGRFWDRHIRTRWPEKLEKWPSYRVIAQMRYFGFEFFTLLRARPYEISTSLVARAGFDVLGFMMCYYALGLRLAFSSTLWLYALTITINALGAIPGAIGFAEVALAALYAQFGISAAIAIAVAVLYRLTGYWLPRAVGGLAWFWMEHETPGHLLNAK
jgi:uncharacterized protein (TIRG00374 family)